MSARRRSHSPPPDSAEHVVARLLEFNPADDLANPGAGTAQLKPVTLTPTGKAATQVELFAPDDKHTPAEGGSPQNHDSPS